MTKEKAIEILTDEMDDIKHGVYASDIETTIWVHDRIEAIKLAIECIQDKINEENTSYPKYISPELVQDLSDFIEENYSDI